MSPQLKQNVTPDFIGKAGVPPFAATPDFIGKAGVPPLRQVMLSCPGELTPRQAKDVIGVELIRLLRSGIHFFL
jgi:hypothetical protein